MTFYEQGRKKGDFEAGIRMALQAILCQPALPVPPRSRCRPTVRAGADLPHHRPRSRVAPVVLPVGHGARRRAAEGAPAAARCARRPVLEKQVRACSPTRAPRRWPTRFASQWLRLQDLDKIAPDYLLYPQYDDTLARRAEARDRAVLRQHRPRGSQRARPADRRLHVRQRAAGASTTASRTSPAATSAACRCRTEPPRPARPGQHPDADLGRRPHLAGAARQVGDGSAARLAAAAAAAERAGARRLGEGDRRRQDAVDARAHGGAPQEPGVQLVPPRDRSARPGARELRRHRRVAHQGQRRAGRPGRRPLRRHQDGRARRACARRC